MHVNVFEREGNKSIPMEKTLPHLQKRFYWPSCREDLWSCRNQCVICATLKHPSPTNMAPLKSVKAGYPLQLVPTYVMGPLPETDAGNRYILIVSDYLTWLTEAYQIPIQEATKVAKKITNEFFFQIITVCIYDQSNCHAYKWNVSSKCMMRHAMDVG